MSYVRCFLYLVSLSINISFIVYGWILSGQTLYVYFSYACGDHGNDHWMGPQSQWADWWLDVGQHSIYYLTPCDHMLIGSKGFGSLGSVSLLSCEMAIGFFREDQGNHY